MSQYTHLMDYEKQLDRSCIASLYEIVDSFPYPLLIFQENTPGDVEFVYKNETASYIDHNKAMEMANKVLNKTPETKLIKVGSTNVELFIYKDKDQDVSINIIKKSSFYAIPKLKIKNPDKDRLKRCIENIRSLNSKLDAMRSRRTLVPLTSEIVE